MQSAYEVPRVSTTRSRAQDIDADLLALPITQDQLTAADDLDQATGGEVSAAAKRGAFAGKPCQLLPTVLRDSGWRSRSVIAIGAGPSQELGSERARRIGATIGLQARQQKRSRIAFALSGAWSDAALESLAEGVTLANYDNGHLKSRLDDRFFVSTVEIAVPDHADASAAIERGVRVGDAVNAARVLINEP